MTHLPQLRIPATYLRGGTSKGVFFRLQDLPPAAQQPGPARDALLLRVIGSPDPYGKQIDGMGGAMFPTGNLIDALEVPGLGTIDATLINAGIPTIFVNARDLGYTGTELQDAINGDPRALTMFQIAGTARSSLVIGTSARVCGSKRVNLRM